MLARILLSALAALALASGASAQVTSCAAPLISEQCTSTEMTTASNGQAATLNIAFSYCSPAAGFGTGQILTNSVSGQLNVQLGANNGGQQGYTVTGLAGFITTQQANFNGPTTFSATNIVPAGNAPILTFSNSATPGAGGATLTVFGPTNIQGVTPATYSAAITSNSPSVIQAGVTLPLPTSVLPSNLQSLASVQQDSCVSVRGDPLFSGFRGQQFYVGGEDGQVMNMISTFNMQLNGRFIQLADGQAITPAEQEKLRLLSQARHIEQPEVAALPRTTAWSHPGNYFGEVGVAMLDDNRLYAKAGSFENGLSKVALNGRPLAVSNEFVVLGQGANTTYIQRVSAHEVMVRTVNVEFTITNSDNFLNIEQVHLERGFRQHNQFGGILGKTVDAKWQWNAEDEKAAVVDSNDLFAHSA